MKQTLSVADFATILDLVNKEIAQLEHYMKKTEENNERFGLRIKIDNQRYQDLQHLKQSLQNLNVEVETPKVEVEEDGN